MSQHDYIIDNAVGASVRADLNNALAAIVTNNSGTSAPSTTYAYQLWVDTTNNLLKQRNSANSAWETVAELPLRGLTKGTALTMNPWTINTSASQAHGLGAEPDLVTGYIECLSATQNYSVGNRIDILLTANDSATAVSNGLTVWRDATNLYLITASSSGLTILDKTTRATNVITVANWKLVLTPWRIGQ